MSLTYRFAGPDGQEITSAAGVVSVRTPDHGLRWDLQDAAARQWPVTPTGPWWLGGGGMEDAASVFWAARYVVPTWTHSGDTPPVPEMPDPERGVLYSPV